MIATTGERFSDFAPYVASVNGAGLVAFQAAMRGGGSGVFAGDGGEVEEAAGPALVRGVTSHPEVNDAGAMSFYGEQLDGGEGAFLFHDGRIETIGDTRGRFASIGPLGPTMNEAGTVAFRADPAEGVGGIFAGVGATVTKVALEDTLLGSTVDDLAANPVSVNASDQVAIRARLADGRQLILRSDPR